MNGILANTSMFYIMLALAISILSSYTMLSFHGNLLRTNGTFRRFWLFGGAFVFGFGVWSKHFVLLLALQERTFFTWSLLAALLLIVFFALMMFVLLSVPNLFRYDLLLGSAILSAGITFMTFFTMLGQPIEHLSIHPGYIVLAITILFAGTYSSLKMSLFRQPKLKWQSSIVFGAAIVMVQLIGYLGIDAEYRVLSTEELLQRNNHLIVFIIGIGTLLILISTIVTWYIDSRMNQTDERYRLLVENSLDTIAIFKGDEWRFVNSAGLAMFEAKDQGELLGQSIYRFLPEQDRAAMKERMRSLIFKGSDKAQEQSWYTLKGNPLHTEIVQTMTTMDNEPAVQMIIRDISERKKNEELLINSEKLYIAGQLAAGIAHEIRNPLTSLKGFLQLIAAGRNNRTYYDIMNIELDRISDIVSELLMLAKPQAMDMVYCDIREVMQDTISLLETEALLHEIHIVRTYSADPLWVYGVDSQLKQVFINLIKNAIEAMENGGIVDIKLYREGNSVCVLIKDGGPGIDEEQLAKIGQPFYTTKQKGTGLGLMVSYKIVDNHHGKIHANSQLGLGTVFEIRLPFRYPEDDAPPKKRN